MRLGPVLLEEVARPVGHLGLLHAALAGARDGLNAKVSEGGGGPPGGPGRGGGAGAVPGEDDRAPVLLWLDGVVLGRGEGGAEAAGGH